MRVKGHRQDYVHAGQSAKGWETTRDERMQIITLRDKASMTWRIGIEVTK